MRGTWPQLEKNHVATGFFASLAIEGPHMWMICPGLSLYENGSNAQMLRDVEGIPIWPFEIFEEPLSIALWFKQNRALSAGDAPFLFASVFPGHLVNHMILFPSDIRAISFSEYVCCPMGRAWGMLPIHLVVNDGMLLGCASHSHNSPIVLARGLNWHDRHVL